MRPAEDVLAPDPPPPPLVWAFLHFSAIGTDMLACHRSLVHLPILLHFRAWSGFFKKKEIIFSQYRSFLGTQRRINFAVHIGDKKCYELRRIASSQWLRSVQITDFSLISALFAESRCDNFFEKIMTQSEK